MYRYFKRRPSFKSLEHEKAWFIRVTLNCSKTSLRSLWNNKVEEIDSITFDPTKAYCVVSQTTANLESFNNIVEKLKEKINNLTVKNTICFATKERQLSAIDLAKEVDCMVVIGGKHSSNTQKLVTICSKVVPTFSIETKEELKKEMFENFKVAGVTAGASTPDWIIDEVIEYLKEI